MLTAVHGAFRCASPLRCTGIGALLILAIVTGVIMMQRRSKRNSFILHSRGRPVGGGGLDGIITPRVVRDEIWVQVNLWMLTKLPRVQY